MDRRKFMGLAAGGVCLACASRLVAKQAPEVADHTLTVVSGSPRERGGQYGRRFKDGVHAFLDNEIYRPFASSSRDELLQYAGRCAKAIEQYSPIIMEELEGMAEGTGLKLEEHVLLTLHEELYHRGVLPKIEHCTVLAAGPPDTADGNAYVGQTWDWMASVYGLSQMLLWKRPEGPSVLAYAYPGLWVGAGLSSAGLAFGWTSAWDKEGIGGPRVGIPSYVFIAHLLYQESLEAAVEEARRAKPAGWFTTVWVDGQGKMANIESTPTELAIEMGGGRMARHTYGSRQITRTPSGQPVQHTPKCRRMQELLDSGQGKLDRSTLQSFFADEQISVVYNDSNFTIDSMLFNTTRREAHVTRGTGGRWNTFRFEGD